MSIIGKIEEDFKEVAKEIETGLGLGEKEAEDVVEDEAGKSDTAAAGESSAAATTESASSAGTEPAG